MSTAAHEYREGIRLAWQGEQWGKAFFDALADAAGDADQCAKWTVLADLEEATGERLAPLVADAPDGASAAEHRSLDAAVAAYSQLPWASAMAQMMTILDPAIERFQTLLDMAPAQDRETMQILLDHEVALKQFAERELAGQATTSLDPVRAVIARARAR